MSDEALIAAAKASIVAYGEKDWDTVGRVVTPGVVYDEVSTGRKVRGIDDVLTIWKGWAAAFPDSKATFERTHVSGNTVIIELIWHGTHTGPPQTDAGALPPANPSRSGLARSSTWQTARRNRSGSTSTWPR